MKIAVFTDTYHPQKNGVVVFLTEALLELSKKHSVVLFAPGRQGPAVEDVNKNFRIYWMPASEFPFYEGYMMAKTTPLEINRILKQEKPDIVHLHAPVLLGIHGLIAAKKRGLPIVATYHTHFPDYLPHLLRGKLYKMVGGIGDFTTKKLIELVFSRADLSTAPTKELVRELKDYGVRNAVCLPNGINFGKMEASARACQEFRKAHGIGKDKKIVLYAGRVSFEKKLDVLLKAFKEVEDGKSVLVIVGTGPSLEKFRGMASELGLNDVIFTGFVDERMLSAAYAVADVFVSASDTETFGMTFVEAMHFGVPVIGVRKLGAKEMISDRKDGFLVKPGSHDRLAARIKELLGDESLRKRMGKEAKKTSAEYSIGKCIERTLELYGGVLDKKGPHIS